MHFRRPISKIILLLLLLLLSLLLLLLLLLLLSLSLLLLLLLSLLLLLLSLLLLLLSIKFFQSEKSVIRTTSSMLFLLQLVTRPPLAMRKVNKEVRERKRKRVVVVSVYNVARL